MERSEIINSKRLKEHFCATNNLPIMLENPYFMERVISLNDVYKTETLFNLFCDCLVDFKNEKEYFLYYDNLLIKIIRHIYTSKEFLTFSKKYKNVKHKMIDYSSDAYLDMETDVPSFISIKLKHDRASIIYLLPQTFIHCLTISEFIGKFTNYQYLINSRAIYNHLYNYVLGSYLTKDHFLNEMHEYLNCNYPELIIIRGKDELLIKARQLKKPLKELRKIISNCPNIGEWFEVKHFDFLNLGNCGMCKVHYSEEDNIELINVPPEIVHQVAKQYFGKEITDNDLYYKIKGKMAKFENEIKNPFINY